MTREAEVAVIEPASATAPPRPFTLAVVLHMVLLPWWLLMWYGIALMAANVTTARPAPETATEWTVVAVEMLAVFGFGIGLWLWLLRTVRRWPRNGFTVGWRYPLLWAFLSTMLAVLAASARGF